MSTLIDDCVEAFVAALAGTAGVDARIYEDRAQAYTKAEAPAIDVALKDAESRTLGDDHPVRSVLNTLLQVEMAIYTRAEVGTDGKETPARKLASPVWESAHAKLMADPTLGGRAVRVRWVRAIWRREEADGTAGWAVHTYELRLAMREQNLRSPN